MLQKSKKEKIKLSLVIPAHKQGQTIINNILVIQKTLMKLSVPYEIIVVVDGKVDNTFSIVKKFKGHNIRVFGYTKNRGKGYAVRYGILKARGEIVGFIDAGMDIDSRCIKSLYQYMQKVDADIVVGSKLHPKSKVVYPFYRVVLSLGYRTLTRVLFGFKILDTQVGLKLFKKRVADDVFPRIAVKRFAFDVETLAVAYTRGYTKIYEAPVTVNFNFDSSITSKSFWYVIYSMLWDTAAVYYRMKFLHYYDKKKKIIT